MSDKMNRPLGCDLKREWVEYAVELEAQLAWHRERDTRAQLELQDLVTENARLKILADNYSAIAIDSNTENAKLREALLEVVTISDRKHDAWDKAKALLEVENGTQENN